MVNGKSVEDILSLYEHNFLSNRVRLRIDCCLVYLDLINHGVSSIFNQDWGMSTDHTIDVVSPDVWLVVVV